MKTIGVNTLRPGMVFSEPVYIEGESLLVPAGIAIRKKDIDNLIKWGYDSVSTDGKIKNSEAAGGPAGASETQAAGGPELSPGVSNEKKDDALSLSGVQENGAYRSYVGLIKKLDSIFSYMGSGVPVEARTLDNLSERLLQAIREERDQIIGFILGGEITGFVMAKSSVNTAILSALIAMELKFPNPKLMQLVTGALLHDVGMLRLPREIAGKSGGLSGAEIRYVQTHPLHSYKIIVRELLYPEAVGLVALQHHERLDGQGYPRRSSGADITMGARIVSAADAFEAMVSEKPYRNSMMGYQAMKNLLSDNSSRFDPAVLKAFIKIMGIYPIGSVIMLNSGAVARVVEIQGDAQLRPKIRILIDEQGKIFKNDEGSLIDLLNEKSLFIAHALDPKKITVK
ncbi:MAG: HD-GYP domain-containing protein [Treponema sp.]|jgi:HD-GYP domain-containing protein (c-di-GMP phosphodiesterase class II)|nr:HD-GYP domain-containing protein [Treponema sp.]